MENDELEGKLLKKAEEILVQTYILVDEPTTEKAAVLVALCEALMGTLKQFVGARIPKRVAKAARRTAKKYLKVVKGGGAA